MQYGLHIGNGSAVMDPVVLRDVAQLAEELGYESIIIGDHVMPPRKINSPYPLKVENPPWHMYQEEYWPDCFAMLAFLAAGRPACSSPRRTAGFAWGCWALLSWLE